jgi:four helix bundle suffix protein
MIQAARSGRQNIADGSRSSATSSQTELRLVNVARSSLEELLLDYEDYLRHRHLTQWSPSCQNAIAIRDVPQRFRRDQSDRTDLTDLSDEERWALYTPWLENESPEVRANAIICLIHQANYLLDRQIVALEAAFVGEGGYSEQLATARLAERVRKRKELDRQSAPADAIPVCPQCGKPMVLRTVKTGGNAGTQFWGCTGFPECRGVVKV